MVIETLIDALNRFDGLKAEGAEGLKGMEKRQFVKNVVQVGLSGYKHYNNIFKMHRKWKENGNKVLKRGRPLNKLDEAEAVVKDVLRDCATDS
mmetsp:Transcript_24743/g.53377  ORF Transcript_24743/g.53377 Transcript_24743/m.53377 type:complete len:93 (+) Transcript_24743:777-1055(+)